MCTVKISLIGQYNPDPQWESAPELDGYANAEVIEVSGGRNGPGKTFDVDFNPTAQYGPDGADNVVHANGQTVLLQPGNYSTQSVLATAVSNLETATFTIYYTDGTSTTVTRRFSTWTTSYSYSGETVVDTMSTIIPAADIRFTRPGIFMIISLRSTPPRPY